MTKTSTLDCRCPEKLEEARRFADSRGLREQFESRITYLVEYGNLMGDGTVATDDNPNKVVNRVTLFSDHAPYSFEFVVNRIAPDGTERFLFNGGLLYYGRGDTGVSTPQFSVRIGATSEGWEIHT